MFSIQDVAPSAQTPDDMFFFNEICYLNEKDVEENLNEHHTSRLKLGEAGPPRVAKHPLPNPLFISFRLLFCSQFSFTWLPQKLPPSKNVAQKLNAPKMSPTKRRHSILLDRPTTYCIGACIKCLGVEYY